MSEIQEDQDVDQPGSTGPVVVNVNVWPSDITSACKILPTSNGSGA